MFRLIIVIPELLFVMLIKIGINFLQFIHVIVLLVIITDHVRILKTGLSVLVQNNMKEIVAKQEVCSLIN